MSPPTGNAPAASAREPLACRTALWPRGLRPLVAETAERGGQVLGIPNLDDGFAAARSLTWPSSRDPLLPVACRRNGPSMARAWGHWADRMEKSQSCRAHRTPTLAFRPFAITSATRCECSFCRTRLRGRLRSLIWPSARAFDLSCTESLRRSSAAVFFCRGPTCTNSSWPLCARSARCAYRATQPGSLKLAMRVCQPATLEA